MHSKSRLIAALFSTLVPLAATAPAHAEPGAQWHHGGRHDETLGFLRGVTLTTAQHTQIHQLMLAGMQQTKPLMLQLRVIQTKMGDALASTAAVNTAELNAWQQQADQIRQQLETAKLSTAIQIRGLLSTEQLAQSAQAHQQLAALHTQERSILHSGKSE